MNNNKLIIITLLLIILFNLTLTIFLKNKKKILTEGLSEATNTEEINPGAGQESVGDLRRRNYEEALRRQQEQVDDERINEPNRCPVKGPACDECKDWSLNDSFLLLRPNQLETTKYWSANCNKNGYGLYTSQYCHDGNYKVERRGNMGVLRCVNEHVNNIDFMKKNISNCPFRDNNICRLCEGWSFGRDPDGSITYIANKCATNNEKEHYYYSPFINSNDCPSLNVVPAETPYGGGFNFKCIDNNNFSSPLRYSVLFDFDNSNNNNSSTGSETSNIQSAPYNNSSPTGSETSNIQSAPYNNSSPTGSETSNIQSSPYNNNSPTGSETSNIETSPYNNNSPIGSETSIIQSSPYNNNSPTGSETSNIQSSPYNNNSSTGIYQLYPIISETCPVKGPACDKCKDWSSKIIDIDDGSNGIRRIKYWTANCDDDKKNGYYTSYYCNNGNYDTVKKGKILKLNYLSCVNKNDPYNINIMKKDICPSSGNVCNTCNSWITKNKNGVKYYSAVCKSDKGSYLREIK
jgi:hypothetical protein